MPSTGRITQWKPPSGAGVRVDSHCYEGYFVPPYYDSMIAKLIVHGRDRAAAIAGMSASLSSFAVAGIHSTIPFHQRVLVHPDFVQNRVSTRWVEEILMTRHSPVGEPGP
jgi:acetyl-CoA carboxylase biotin carboxylase subunit